MEQQYVLAYDLGTSGVKGALVTLEGTLVTTATAAYPLYRPAPAWAEQEPEDYWRGVCTVTRKLLAITGIRPETVAGIAFGTQWKGVIPIAADGTVLHRSMIWLDLRSVDQARRLTQHFKGSVFTPDSCWPKLMWLRENKPQVVDAASMILEVNGFLKWKATGEFTVDISNSFVHSPDPELETKYAAYLAFAGIPQEKLPRLVHAQDTVGHLTATAAEELGLVPGIPVFGGNNDIQAAAVGSGCAPIGGVHIYFGTSGWIGVTIPHQSILWGSAFDEMRDIRMYGTKAVGLALNWVVDRYYAAEKAAMGDDVFALVSREAAEIPPGCDGVTVLPGIFLGETTDVRFYGVTDAHDRRHFVRAVMETVCCHLRWRYETAMSHQPIPPVVHAIGGGACSDVWMQILADVLGTQVLVPAFPRHTGAIGTAWSALIGLGVSADFDKAASQLCMERQFLPSGTHAAYEEAYLRYISLVKR